MLAAVAVYRFIYNPAISIITALVVLGIFVFQTGIEIHFENNKYRFILAFGPIGIGKWKELPLIKHVAILSVRLRENLTARSGLTTTYVKKVIQVSLITQSNQKLKLIETTDYTRAFDTAKAIGNKQNLQVWDATSKVGKYV